MRARWAAAVLLAGSLVVTAPGAAHASRRHDRDRDHCRRDCRRSDDHGGNGERRKCVGLIALCDSVIVIPTPFTPAPEEQALTLPPGTDPRCLPFHCDPKPTALFPPQPAKVVELIQAFAAGIGKSAGDLAGAIAAFPPALLL